MADAQWIADYEASAQEAIDAKREHDLTTFPKLYPISGALGIKAPPKESWYKLVPER